MLDTKYTDGESHPSNSPNGRSLLLDFEPNLVNKHQHQLQSTGFENFNINKIKEEYPVKQNKGRKRCKRKVNAFGSFGDDRDSVIEKPNEKSKVYPFQGIGSDFAYGPRSDKATNIPRLFPVLKSHSAMNRDSISTVEDLANLRVVPRSEQHDGGYTWRRTVAARDSKSEPRFNYADIAKFDS